jgi:phosphate/sulfate permease
MIILVLLIATALAFDFTNGFHDTGNAMATSIATGALKPKTAVLLAGVLNLVGAFLSVEVAVTVTTSVLKVQDSKSGQLLPNITPSMGLTIIFAGLIGGILWNLLTWLFGIPSSSSHALFGGLIGAGLAALGMAGVNWTGVTSKVLVPAVAAPVIAGLVAACGTWLVYRITRNVMQKRREDGFRWGQIATASLVALSHGTNDAQKTMGVIALALITTGHLTGDVKRDGLPFWIIFSCALAIGLGTYIGGWRVILGRNHFELQCRGHGAVDHPRGDRLDPGQRCRQAGRRSALGGRRPDGRRLARHPARRRTHGCAGVLAVARGRVADRLRPGGRRADLRHSVRAVVLHLVARPEAEGRRQQRQRRLGRQDQLRRSSRCAGSRRRRQGQGRRCGLTVDPSS